jgi:hypothetical protein
MPNSNASDHPSSHTSGRAQAVAPSSASGGDVAPATAAWFAEFLMDRATRKPSEHTMKAYRQDFSAYRNTSTPGVFGVLPQSFLFVQLLQGQFLSHCRCTPYCC